MRKAYHKAINSDWTNLIYGNKDKKAKMSDTVRFITQYNRQHFDIRKIRRNWCHLSLDPKISKCVCTAPEMSFRRACSLMEDLVASHYSGSSRSDPCVIKGTFRCGHCEQCKLLMEGQVHVLPNGRWHKAKHYVDCTTLGVIYLFRCPCSVFYVGKTILHLNKQI